MFKNKVYKYLANEKKFSNLKYFYIVPYSFFLNIPSFLLFFGLIIETKENMKRKKCFDGVNLIKLKKLLKKIIFD